MLALRASPNASISSAQNGNTGQKPWNTKNKAKPIKNRQVETKKSSAPAGFSEQLGCSSMRCSMSTRITQPQPSMHWPEPLGSGAERLSPAAPHLQLPFDLFEGNGGRIGVTAPGRPGRTPRMAENHLIRGRQAAVLPKDLVGRL